MRDLDLGLLKYEILKNTFGHNSFRPLQEEAVDAIMQRQDLLMILPTGGGKSLSFQLPALMMDGTTVVISPLLALMQDQVHALNAQKIPAAMISSMQKSSEIEQVVNRLLSNELSFLYISPERLNTSWMYGLLEKIKVNFFVIDEAHCISEWGHEFRNDYRALSSLKQRYPDTTIAAFTATATEHVKNDILRLLNLKNPKVLQGKIFRENLFIMAKHRIKNGLDQLYDFLKDKKEQNGIVYAFSRKNTESICAALAQKGYKVRAYHAGLSTDERSRTYEMFVHDEIDIIVATIAFGMGIDKSNIRYVVHMSLPKTLENYYQEIGRAGRDGESADVLLLFSASDIIQQKMFINEIEDEAYKSHLLQKLSFMNRYATSQTCRHEQIAAYFEDKIDECGSACDNCIETDMELKDITKESQMFLSAIYRTDERFGKNYIIDILRGSKDQKILSNFHQNLSVYGIGKEISKKEWFVIYERLLEIEAVDIGEFQALKLNDKAKLILKGKESVDIKQERLDIKVKPVKKSIEDIGYDSEIFEKLRALRADIAKEDAVPAYIVFGDKTLKHMAAMLPKTQEEMLEINGVGMKKYESYGERFLDLIKECNNQTLKETVS